MIETKAEFRKTLIIPKDPVKSGQGDKQVDVWSIRDRDDKDGAKGSQSTCTTPAAVEWTVDQRFRSHLQMAVNTRAITWVAAQAIATREGVGKLHDPDEEDPVAKRMRESRGALGRDHTLPLEGAIPGGLSAALKRLEALPPDHVAWVHDMPRFPADVPEIIGATQTEFDDQMAVARDVMTERRSALADLAANRKPSTLAKAAQSVLKFLGALAIFILTTAAARRPR